MFSEIKAKIKREFELYEEALKVLLLAVCATAVLSFFGFYHSQLLYDIIVLYLLFKYSARFHGMKQDDSKK